MGRVLQFAALLRVSESEPLQLWNRTFVSHNNLK